MSLEKPWPAARPLPSVRAFERVQRQPKRIMLRTTDGAEIRGLIHIPPGSRLIDFLNRESERYIAITDAQLADRHGVEHLAFVAVNKAQVTVVVELADVAEVAVEDSQAG